MSLIEFCVVLQLTLTVPASWIGQDHFERVEFKIGMRD